MQKRGQITTFMVLGLILVILIGVLAYFSYFRVSNFESEMRKSLLVPEQIKPVKASFDQCLSETAENGIRILGLQGGYIQTPFDPLKNNPVNIFSNELTLFKGLNIPYWFYEDAGLVTREQIPKKEDMEFQLSEYIKESSRLCFLNVENYKEQGYEINFKELEDVNSDIKNEVANIIIKYPMNIKKGNIDFNINKHYVQLKVPLGRFYKVSKEILEKENTEYFLENYTYDMMVVYDEIPLTDVSFDCAPKIWSKTEITDNFKNILTSNVPAIKISDSDYSLANEFHKYFVVALDTEENLDKININFLYSPDWPFYLDVNPSAEILKEDSISEKISSVLVKKLANFLCVNQHHFVYDIKYPVLITLTDRSALNNNGYTFQFPLQVIIKNNQPRENIFAKELNYKKTPVCEKLSKKINLNVFNRNGIELDNFNVRYKCIVSECDIEKVDDSYLFPACMNGLLTVEKEDYYKTEMQFSTNEESSVSLILDPFYFLDFNVKVVDKNTGTRDPFESEQIYIEFNNLDNGYSFIVQYPYVEELNKIRLTSGLYNIKSYIISESSQPFEIQGETKTICTKIPYGGVMGVLGFEREKCVDSKIADLELNQVLKGGNEFNYQITEQTLINSDEVTIFVYAGQAPVTQEGLIEVSENLIKNEVVYPQFK